MDYTVHGILQARTGVGSLSLLQGIFPTQGLNQVSHIAGGFFTKWAIRETDMKIIYSLLFCQIFIAVELDYLRLIRVLTGFIIFWFIEYWLVLLYFIY